MKFLKAIKPFSQASSDQSENGLLPELLRRDTAYQEAMRYNDRKMEKEEHNAALEQAVSDMLLDNTEFYKQFMDNAEFNRWVSDAVFTLT